VHCIFCTNRIEDKADNCYFCGESTTVSDHSTPLNLDWILHVPLLPQVGATVPLNAPEEHQYIIQDIAGFGGMGVVYRAQRKIVRDIVAIKVLKPRFAQHKGFVYRFLKEARTTARLRHENILQIYSLNEGAKNVLPFFVMEFLKGQSLRELLVDKETKKRREPVELKRAIDLMCEICRGVGYAHRFGNDEKMIHRDLKPENIWLLPFDPDVDDKESVKVLDFGIVKAREEDEQSQYYTGTGSVMGTDRYMSPEQCEGIELDVRSDVYSLGIILYEMLAGRPPFVAKTREGYRTQHRKSTPPPFSEELNIPFEIEAVVMSTLAKEPEERPADALELRRELRKAYQDYLKRLSKRPVHDDWMQRSTVGKALKRRARISKLTEEIQEAQQAEDWGRAVEKLNDLIKMNSASQEVKQALAHAQQQQSLSTLYKQGQKLYEADQLSEALDIFAKLQEQYKDYKDVARLINAISDELFKKRFNTLYAEAEALIAEENWSAAVEKLKALLELSSSNKEVSVLLSYAEKQKDLEELYLEGQRNYKAGKWPEALNIFRQIDDSENTYKDVAARIEELQSKIKCEQIDALYQRAQSEIDKEKWDAAIESLQSLLQLDQKHVDARAKLAFTQQRAYIARLYAEGKEHVAAARRHEALDSFHQVQAIDPAYKDIRSLVKEVQAELDKVKIENLFVTAQQEITKEKWPIAIDILQELLQQAPDYPEARGRFEFAKKQQALSNLYSAALNHLEANRINEALSDFQRINDSDKNYKDVKSLIDKAQRKLTQQRIIQLLREASAFFDKKDWSEATNKLNEVLRLEPNHINALAALDEVRHKENEQRDAELKERLAKFKVKRGNKSRDDEWKKEKSIKWLRSVIAIGVTLVLFTVIAFVYLAVSGDKPSPLTNNSIEVNHNLSTVTPQASKPSMVAPRLNDKWKDKSHSIQVPELGIEMIMTVAFSPYGQRLVSAGKWGAVLLNITSQKKVDMIAAKNTLVNAAIFSPDGALIATASDDGSVRLLNADDGTLNVELRKKTSSIKALSLAFSLDNKTLAVGNSDGTISFWDIEHKASKTPLKTDRKKAILSLAFSPDKNLLAAGLADGNILLWNIQGEVYGIPQTLKEHGDSVNSLAFSSDAKTLASGSYDMKVILWNMENPTITEPKILRHTTQVTSVAFSPDAALLVTGGNKNIINLWNLLDAKRETPWGTLSTDKPVLSIAYSADGKFLAAGDQGGQLFLWDMSGVKQ
jgi:WD40 repeat protein/serine/threonine protein kinase